MTVQNLRLLYVTTSTPEQSRDDVSTIAVAIVWLCVKDHMIVMAYKRALRNATQVAVAHADATDSMLADLACRVGTWCSRPDDMLVACLHCHVHSSGSIRLARQGEVSHHSNPYACNAAWKIAQGHFFPLHHLRTQLPSASVNDNLGMSLYCSLHRRGWA